MARPSAHRRVLVLTKTRLGETDLILTALAADGSLVRGVAKGARKPANSFAVRLEVFSVADVLMASGRNLDIFKEARLIDGHERLRGNPEAVFAAAPPLELASRIAQPDLPLPRFFDATLRGLEVMESLASADEIASVAPLLALCDGMLLKDLAFAGLRPATDRCAICGQKTDMSGGASVAFSPSAGGALCDRCGRETLATRVDGRLVAWAAFMLGSPFAAIAEQHPSAAEGLAVLDLICQFAKTHLGTTLRSVDILKRSGLFSA